MLTVLIQINWCPVNALSVWIVFVFSFSSFVFEAVLHLAHPKISLSMQHQSLGEESLMRKQQECQQPQCLCTNHILNNSRKSYQQRLPIVP